MSKSQINGVTGGSASITYDHITSYPLVSDLLSYYKSMPIGAKSIEISTNLYNSFGKPVISHPVVQNPYSYVYPYAKKVDELGDSTLSHVDANLPALKETDLSTLKSYFSSVFHYPFEVANSGKDYVLNTYGDEYSKSGGKGIVFAGKAVITTEIRIAVEAVNKVASFVGPKKDELASKADEAKSIGQDKASKAKKTAESKKDELTK